MALFGKGMGVMDVIRCDETDYLIWKWRPNGNSTESIARSNSIRWGSSLRVKDGSVAVFIYTKPDGTVQDYFEGPVDLFVDTKNFPVLSTLIGKLFNGSSPFQAEIYFINLAKLIQVKFGVPYFDVFDPRFQEFGVPTAVRGSINFKIDDYREFIKLNRLQDFQIGTFEAQIKDAVTRYVKQIVINAPDVLAIPVIQLERHISDISDTIQKELHNALQENYGISVTDVDLSAIDLDKTSEGYKHLASITQNKAATFVQRAGIVANTVSMQRAGSKRITEARKEALGQGGGGINIEAVGQTISGVFSGIFGFGKKSENTPPPIPTVEYYVAIAGKQTGPFDMDTLVEMKEQGIITRDSLVWKNGMKEWEKAGSIGELSFVFE